MVVGMVVYPDSKVHVAHMGPTWVLLGPGGSHVDPMNLAIRWVLCIWPTPVKMLFFMIVLLSPWALQAGSQPDWQASVPVMMPRALQAVSLTDRLQYQ